MAGFRWLPLLLVALGTVAAQTGGKEPVRVPEQIATLLRPNPRFAAAVGNRMRTTGQQGVRQWDRVRREQERWWELGEAIAHLASQKTAAADEALVVLMCY